MSTSQMAMMLCGLGVEAGMVYVWVACRTVWSLATRAMAEHIRNKVLYNKALYEPTLLYFTFLLAVSQNVAHLSVDRKWLTVWLG